jgi:hypothetical protein
MATKCGRLQRTDCNSEPMATGERLAGNRNPRCALQLREARNVSGWMRAAATAPSCVKGFHAGRTSQLLTDNTMRSDLELGPVRSDLLCSGFEFGDGFG